jgi:hypothetical protein
MFKIFEVKGGKFEVLPQVSPKNIKKGLIGLVIIGIISLLSGWLNISEKEVWKYYQLLIGALNLGNSLPEFSNNKHSLDAKIESAVDRALAEATEEYNRIIEEYDKKYKPRYMDEKNDETLCHSEECKKLAPPMRICSPVFDGSDCNWKFEDK